MPNSSQHGSAAPRIELQLLPSTALAALDEGSLDRASGVFGRPLPKSFLDHEGLWTLRLAQIMERPEILRWLVHAIYAPELDAIVGHAGFHGPPDEHGMVEIGYTITPEFRGRGYARATVAALIDKARNAPGVETVRASISPENAASLATIRPFGFVQMGEQIDEEDGLELIFELPLSSRYRTSATPRA